VAQFDRTILPGGEGNITLKVYTGGYEGRIHKKAKVYTNDPRRKVEILHMKAFVIVPIHISHRYVTFKGAINIPGTKTVNIRAEKERPLTLEPIHFDLNEKVSYRIEEVEAGKIFKIHFTTIPGSAEAYHGSLKLKTNYPEKPEINIPIWGRFKKGS